MLVQALMEISQPTDAELLFRGEVKVDAALADSGFFGDVLYGRFAISVSLEQDSG